MTILLIIGAVLMTIGMLTTIATGTVKGGNLAAVTCLNAYLITVMVVAAVKL